MPAAKVFFHRGTRMVNLDGYELRLLEDNVAAGEALTFPADSINRVLYVAHGGIVVEGQELGEDRAWHGRGAARVAAGPSGAALWCWELAPAGSAAFREQGAHGVSELKLRRRLSGAMADGVLIRCDSVAFPPGGCAYLHTHQGPGIRCLIEGGIRIDTAGESRSYAPGGAWFEAGPEPVFAQAADRPTRFIRIMILPARLLGQSSISYVKAEDRDKPKSQRYRVYLDAPIQV
jgi:hypothetical protein